MKTEAASGTDPLDQDPRGRLLAATLEGIGDIGWADLTTAEIVRRARLSKRTFYEHFATKEACLLALYEHMSGKLLDDLDAAVEDAPCGEGRLAVGAAFYLARLQENPRVVRTFAIEVLHLGSEGLAIRRRVMRRFAAFLRREMNATGRRPPISLAVAMVIVGGINELTLEAFEEDRIDRLGELVEPITEVVRGVVGADFLGPHAAMEHRPAGRGGTHRAPKERPKLSSKRSL